MARIAVTVQNVTVNGNSLSIGTDAKQRDGFLLYDVDKKQQLVEQTINPPGQERYVMPLDRQDLLDYINGNGSYSGILDSNSPTVTSAELDEMLADTRGSGGSNQGNYTSGGSGDDISRSNVKSVLNGHSNISSTNDTEADAFRDRISHKFVETGDFKLSYDNGVINGLRNQNWVKVFPNDSSGTYTLT